MSELINKHTLFLITLTFVVNSYCSIVTPKLDVLFYEGDTLLISKLYKDKILKTIVKNEAFNKYYRPNQSYKYTAYWKIEQGKLYLLKISNCRSYFCSNETSSDTLNLNDYRFFRRKNKNGKIDLTPKNRTLFVHDRFVLRGGWMSTYLIDYEFHFKNKRLNSIDTTYNYFDNPERLKRYSFQQIHDTILEIIQDNIFIQPSGLPTKVIDFSLEVGVANDGKFEYLDMFNIFDRSIQDTVAFETINKIIDISMVETVLEKCKWDEMKSLSKDSFIFNFVLRLENDEYELIFQFIH